MKFLLFFILIAVASYGAQSTVGLPACSTTIATANPGDTIYVTGNDTIWRKYPIVIDKSLWVIGVTTNGVKPTIFDSVGSGFQVAVFTISTDSTDTVRLSNFKIMSFTGHTDGVIYIKDSKYFRVDRVDLYDSVTMSRGFRTAGFARGVIDSCTINLSHQLTVQGITTIGPGDVSWTQPSSYGTQDNIFIEDCIFNYAYLNDGAVDIFNGARVVIRHCIVNGTVITWHGFDSGGYRGPFSVEIAHCTLDRNFGSAYPALKSRGGSALIHDNTFTGSGYSNMYTITNYRSNPDFYGTHTGPNGSSVLIDTSAARRSNPFSGGNVDYVFKGSDVDTVVSFNDTSITANSSITWNTGDVYGVTYYIPADNCGMCIGSSSCDGNTTPADSGWPCRDQEGRGTDQGSNPTYLWNNDYKGDTSPAAVVASGGYQQLHVQEGRDYHDNATKPDFTEYTYPHPLRTEMQTGPTYRLGRVNFSGVRQ